MNLLRWIDQGPVSEPVREPFEFDDSVELIVAGLGAAGAIALVTAARHGLKAMGIEKLTIMGGSSTGGGISSYYWGIPGGLFEELDRKSREMASEVFVACKSFHPEARHLVLESAALEAGARIEYESRVTGVFMEARRVCGVQWVSPGGIRNTGCRMLMDATGDGEVCATAGCEFTLGRDFDAAPQPWSHVSCWIDGNRHRYDNWDAGSTLDITDGDAVSDAVVDGWVLHLRDKYEESEKLLFAGRLPGQREGRLIKGEMMLRLSDHLAGNMTGEPVAYEYVHLDTHAVDLAFESDAVQEWMVVAGMGGHTLCIPVPLQAMIPEGFEGLLAVGRCLSADHDMAQALRMQRAMQQCGEAAATAAALALARGIGISDVPYAALAAELRRSGCLPEKPPPNLAAGLPCSPSGIRDGLASGKPGPAVWAARLSGTEIRPLLREWLEEPDTRLAVHSALSLGLLEDASSSPMLRRIIADRGYPAECSGLSDSRLLCAALYLSGRLADLDAIPAIQELFQSPDIPFDIFSHSFMALLRMGRTAQRSREGLAVLMCSVLENEDFHQELPSFRRRPLESAETYFRIAAAREFDLWGVPHRLMEHVDASRLTPRESALHSCKIPASV